jgi:hypothetical protein
MLPRNRPFLFLPVFLMLAQLSVFPDRVTTSLNGTWEVGEGAVSPAARA